MPSLGANDRRSRGPGYSFFVSLAVFAAVAPAIAAEIPRDLLTRENALLCMSPFRLNEAMSAAGDPNWLKSLDCALVPAGLPIKRIDVSPVPDSSKPWQVRLSMPGTDGFTMWGNVFEFNTLDGKRVFDIYREDAKRIHEELERRKSRR